MGPSGIFSQVLDESLNPKLKLTNFTLQSGQNEVKSQMKKPVVSKKNDVGVQIRCKQIKDKVKFHCEVSDLYRVLTEPEAGTH